MIPLWIYIRIRTILNVPGVSACVCLHEIVCAHAHAHVCAHACMPACNCVFLRVCVCLHAIVCASVAFLILNVAKSAAYSAIFFFCFQLPGYYFCPAPGMTRHPIHYPRVKGYFIFLFFYFCSDFILFFNFENPESH